ncbi:MAG TPA: hypothetical protein VNE61_05720 [Ktedonobacteraceae bacterium]|nr:hypothetical protein [Ktedonobacteraceae bacterium]
MAEEKTPSPTAKSANPIGSGSKSKASAKNAQSRIGGTAVPGAKSTQPKPPPTSQQQQQADSYNRTMRRRMEQMGTAPDANRGLAQQRKRLEKRKKRREVRKEEVKKVAARGPSKITLGRGTFFFLLGAIALVILIIVLAILLNHHII